MKKSTVLLFVTNYILMLLNAALIAYGIKGYFLEGQGESLFTLSVGVAGLITTALWDRD